MCACFQQRSGLRVQEGGDLSVRLYAVAAQVCGLYAQAQWVAQQCFPQTAQGEYLDHHAQLRGLERKEATRSEGILRFSVGTPGETDRVIPQGSVCMTADLVRFETVREGVLSAGSTQVDVPARAVEAGSQGNVPAGRVVSMAVAPVGVAGCSNPEPFTGGADAEIDESLRERVLDTYLRLPNGANAAFYQQGALSFDQVAAATVIPRARGQGTVDVVVATRSGLPGSDLLQQLQQYFQTRREIAVDVAVRAPTTVPVTVRVQIACPQGQDKETVKAQVQEALRGWFTGKRLGQDVLRARLGSVIFGCDGVENYHILSPAADVRIQTDQLPILGSVSVEDLT